MFELGHRHCLATFFALLPTRPTDRPNHLSSFLPNCCFCLFFYHFQFHSIAITHTRPPPLTLPGCWILFPLLILLSLSLSLFVFVFVYAKLSLSPFPVYMAKLMSSQFRTNLSTWSMSPTPNYNRLSLSLYSFHLVCVFLCFLLLPSHTQYLFSPFRPHPFASCFFSSPPCMCNFYFVFFNFITFVGFVSIICVWVRYLLLFWWVFHLQSVSVSLSLSLPSRKSIPPEVSPSWYYSTLSIRM